MSQNLIPANKDPKILIKEKNKYFWHVEQTRKDRKPGSDGTDIRTTTWVKVYRDLDYRRIFEQKDLRPNRRGGPVVKGGMNFLPACGIREARLVHDPILQKEIEAREKEERDLRLQNDDLGTQTPDDSPAAEVNDDSGTAKRPVRRTKK
jgi:hypothetical protein